MANAIEILINARNNASGPIQQATVSVESLAKAAAASIVTFAAMQFSLQAVAQASVGLARGFADEVEQLGRLETLTGLTSEQLQVFRRGLDQNGLSADQLGSALQYFQTKLTNNSREMGLYGITSKNTFEALQQLRRALDGAGNDAERTAIAAATLGQRNVELADTVSKVAASYNDELNAALASGAVLGDQQLQKFGALDNALDAFSDTWRSLQIESAQFFLPLLKFLADTLNLLNRLLVAFNRWTQSMAQGLSTGIVRVLGGRRSGGGGTWGPENGDSEPFDAEAWKARRRQAEAAAAAGSAGFGMAAGLPALGLLYGAGGNQPGLRGESPLKELASLVSEQVEPAAQKLDDTFKSMHTTLSNLEQAAFTLASGLQSTISNALFSVLTGVQSIGAAFRSLINGIFQSIADAIAQYFAQQAAGFLLQGLGFLVGGPAGAAIGGVGRGVRGASAAPMGNTYVIQSIDSKSVLDSITAPTGSMRGANDRVLEVALAARL